MRMSGESALLYILPIFFLEGVVNTQTTPTGPPKPHPPEAGLVEVKRVRWSLKSFVVKTRDSLRKKPFFAYFLSEVGGSGGSPTSVCVLSPLHSCQGQRVRSSFLT